MANSLLDVIFSDITLDDVPMRNFQDSPFNVDAYTQDSSECAYTHYQWYEGFG